MMAGAGLCCIVAARGLNMAVAMLGWGMEGMRSMVAAMFDGMERMGSKMAAMLGMVGMGRAPRDMA
jgi:hypothetical protein